MKSKGFSPKFTITNRIAAGLTRIERARGFLEAATLSEEWIREMGNRALMLEAHHTTHIEGTQLTLDQAERLWQGDSVSEADPDEARELLNYRKAFDFVSEYLKSGDPITEGLIREIHKRLVEGVRENNMNMTGWIEYYIEGLSTQLAEVRDRGEQAIRRDVLTKEHKLSDRQAKALGHILGHDRLTIQDYERLCPEVNRRSLQRDLKAMVDLDLLISEGATNKLVYRMRKVS